jgi:hypothetical protein
MYICLYKQAMKATKFGALANLISATSKVFPCIYLYIRIYVYT